jgi:hypothetical protein
MTMFLVLSLAGTAPIAQLQQRGMPRDRVAVNGTFLLGCALELLLGLLLGSWLL